MIKKNPQSGQAMLTAVIFFLVISSTVVLGVATPILKQARISRDLIYSKQSYLLAEGGLEDSLYRVKNNMAIVSGETIVVNGYTTTLTIINTSTGKTLIAESDRDGYVRKMEADIVQGAGVAFNYGVQVGTGGFVMANNSNVQGNVYVNGDITGSNGAYITGTVIAANTAAQTTDQANETPSSISSCTASNCIDFRKTSNVRDVAQSFQVSTSTPINKIQLYVKKTGTPGNVTVNIVTDSSGSPSSNVLAQGTLSSAAVTTNFGWIDVVLTTNPGFVPGTTYWIVTNNGTQSSTNYYTIGANTSYISGVTKIGQYNSSWQDTSPSGLDMYFRLYLGGLTATINGVTIGTGSTGDAWAHNVTNSTIRGSLYCQTGSGNNKSCNTSRTDPSPTAFPVSDANIQQWKDDASAGTLYTGNKTQNGGSLGPIKITGNLTLSGNITLTGTVWVQGNITSSNNASVQLAAGYGGNSGVIVADGRVSLSNNVTFSGSGLTGSYIMLLTTSDCPTSASCGGSYAIDVSNNVGAVILNAQKGTLHFSNNATTKAATANTISLDNNASVIYESGLADLNFSSGPSGGWNVTSWSEVQ